MSSSDPSFQYETQNALLSRLLSAHFLERSTEHHHLPTSVCAGSFCGKSSTTSRVTAVARTCFTAPTRARTRPSRCASCGSTGAARLCTTGPQSRRWNGWCGMFIFPSTGTRSSRIISPDRRCPGERWREGRGRERGETSQGCLEVCLIGSGEVGR